MQRTQKAIEEAFAILFVFDRSEGILKEDLELLEDVKNKWNGRSNLPPRSDGTPIPSEIAKIIGILNKRDLNPAPVIWDAELHNSRGDDLSTTLQLNKLISVSALRGDNIDSILPAISELISANNIPPLVMRTRHLDALRRAGMAIERAISLIGVDLKPALPELISYEIREAINSLGEITGEVTSEDILNRIFSEFCIGK